MRARTRLAAVALAAVTLTGLTTLAAAPAAQAHATIVSTDPGNGDELDTAPAAVHVTFDEPVTLASARGAAAVLDADGRRVDAGSPTLDAARTTLTVPLRPGLPRGTYVASWSVVSADSHPVGGSLQFGVGVPASTLVAEPTGPSPTLTLAAGLAKGATYLALVVGLGLWPAARLLGAGPDELRGVRRAAAVGLVVGVVASLGQVVVQHVWVASAALPTAAHTGGASGLVAFAGSSYAAWVWVRVAALGASLGVGAWAARTARTGRLGATWTRPDAVLAALAVVALGTVVADGHGGSGAWWRFVVTLAHASAAVAWLGGLAVLAWALLRRRLSAERLDRLGAWSLYAGTAVAVLVASGVVQAVVGVRYPGALLTTTYGILLVAKVALVTVAAGLGAAGNRWTRTQRRLGLPAPGQTARLRRRVRIEAAVAAGVVVVSGVLSSVTPAEAAYAPTAAVHAQVGPYVVTLEASPARRGPETLRVTATAPTADAPLAQTVSVVLRQDDGPVRGLAATFPYRVPGAISPDRPTPVTFTSAAVNVPTTGPWIATVTVATDRFDQYTADLPFQVE